MGGSESERELDEDGVKQSLSLSNKIIEKINENTIIYSSPFKRALDSLAPLKEKYPNVQIIPTDALKEINIGKSHDLTKHEIIQKMWNNSEFKVESGESQVECYSKLKPFLEKVFSEFKNENKNIILVTHGNLIGIILQYFFDLEFNFNSWKQISMPDMYILNFDENKKATGFKRDVENIDNLFYVK
jgi:2,3-bisphosphoglycerate-dependent phosphoglycerate mutase